MAVPLKTVLQQAAIKSGLVTRDQLERAFVAARQPQLGPPAPRVDVTDDQLARQLVAMGFVTTYQAEQLKAGRTKLTLGGYVITDWIAQGGMGHVFKARHQFMGREVAIKVLPPSKSTPSAISSFTREIQTQASLDHENLVRAYDAGKDGNVYYLVTEYVRGTDLRRLVRLEGKLTMPTAAILVSQAAAGLESAHSRGLIHRDVKPGNILVTEGGKAKVSDLGLAAFLSDGDEGQLHKIVGTADYISPEQILNPERTSRASDIYSLGCTLYYAVTGKVPFPGGTTREKARRHCEETPWHPRRFHPELSEEFVEVIADMMEKEPEDRVGSAAEVIARLEPWARRATPVHFAPSKTFWMPPPPPNAGGPMEEDLQATVDGSYDSLEISSKSFHRQAMQATDAVSKAEQETHADSAAEPPPFPSSTVDPTTPAANLRIPHAVSFALGWLLGLIAGAVAWGWWQSLGGR